MTFNSNINLMKEVSTCLHETISFHAEYEFKNILDNFPSGENERHIKKILANSSISMVTVKYPIFLPKR